MAEAAQITKTEAVEKLQRAQASLKRLREEGKRVAKQGTNVIMTAAGGAAAGILSVQMPKVPNTNVDTDLALGSVLVALGVADIAGEFSEQVTALGSGMLAAATARETRKIMAQRG